jgi:cytidylate kinase
VSENTNESTGNTVNANEVKSDENAIENRPANPQSETVTENVTTPEEKQAKKEVQQEIRESLNNENKSDEAKEVSQSTEKTNKPETVKETPKEEVQKEIRESFNESTEEAQSEQIEEQIEEIKAPEPVINHYNGNTVVAIDGPSGTGKSTTAKLLAKRLNYLYIDSGAMYRAVTYSVLQNKIPVTDIAAIIEHTKGLDIVLEDEKVMLNGEDISAPVRGVQVTSNVSTISAIKEVREMLVAKQREYAQTNSVVMDGRDIGTVVFPYAQYKYFLICDLKTRAARRQQDFRDLGLEIATNKIVMELRKRDDIDTKREESPLRKADDAVEVDTTNMIIEEQVECIYRKIVPR